MKTVLMAVAGLVFSAGAMAAEDATLLTRVIGDSELVYCRMGTCESVYADAAYNDDDSATVPAERMDSLGGYFKLVYTDGKFSQKELDSVAGKVKEYWSVRYNGNKYIADDNLCEVKSFSMGYKQLIGCQESISGDFFQLKP